MSGRALCLAVSVIIAVINAPHAALAVSLVEGVDTSLSGTTAIARPELAGPIIEDVLTPYSFTSNDGLIAVSGNIQNRVVREDVAGTLDFYWRIIPDSTSTGPITAIRLGGFDSFALDGDFRTDGSGTIGPDIAHNFGGGFVNFIFSNGVGAQDSSRFFFLKTQATAYDTIGLYDLLCAREGCVSDAFTTFAPVMVPEPATSLLVVLGLGGLIAARRRSKSK